MFKIDDKVRLKRNFIPDDNSDYSNEDYAKTFPYECCDGIDTVFTIVASQEGDIRVTTSNRKGRNSRCEIKRFELIQETPKQIHEMKLDDYVRAINKMGDSWNKGAST